MYMSSLAPRLGQNLWETLGFPNLPPRETRSFSRPLSRSSPDAKYSGKTNPAQGGVVLQMLDIAREIGTFWKQNKAHIWIPNIKQGFFGITRPTSKEMAEFASRK